MLFVNVRDYIVFSENSTDENPPDLSVLGDDDPYLDAADRLEGQIETQVSIINSIDDKSEHVTRLIGILIGLVFSVLSLVVNYKPAQFGEATLPIELAFIFGIASLLLAMGAAIVTYLSSRFRIGLHYTVGYYLSDPDDDVDFDVHIRRVCGSYGQVIEENKQVIETNSKRFRRALSFLLIGVLFLSAAGSLYLGGFSKQRAWYGFGVSILITVVTGWYILTGKYLTLEREETSHG